MRGKIEEGEIVIFATNAQPRLAKVARILKGNEYIVVPLKGCREAKRKEAELMPIKKIQSLINN